jgi:hypothetical protein
MTYPLTDESREAPGSAGPSVLRRRRSEGRIDEHVEIGSAGAGVAGRSKERWEDSVESGEDDRPMSRDGLRLNRILTKKSELRKLVAALSRAEFFAKLHDEDVAAARWDDAIQRTFD